MIVLVYLKQPRLDSLFIESPKDTLLPHPACLKRMFLRRPGPPIAMGMGFRVWDVRTSGSPSVYFGEPSLLRFTISSAFPDKVLYVFTEKWQ